MGRLQISTIDCNYQELDRHLKEQLIHSLNVTDMLGETIGELTKVKENGTIMNENVLAWAKIVEAQRAQSVVMNSVTEAKEFHKIKVSKCMQGQSQKKHTKTSTKQTCRYCSSSHPQDNV